MVRSIPDEKFKIVSAEHLTMLPRMQCVKHQVETSSCLRNSAICYTRRPIRSLAVIIDSCRSAHDLEHLEAYPLRGWNSQKVLRITDEVKIWPEEDMHLYADLPKVAMDLR